MLSHVCTPTGKYRLLLFPPLPRLSTACAQLPARRFRPRADLQLGSILHYVDPAAYMHDDPYGHAMALPSTQV
jgi:hypothetical protein